MARRYTIQFSMLNTYKVYIELDGERQAGREAGKERGREGGSKGRVAWAGASDEAMM